MFAKSLKVTVFFLLCLALVLGACAPAATVPAPTAVVKEVEKTVVVTQIVQSAPQVITATPQPTKDTSKDPVTLKFTTWTSNEAHLKMLNEIADAYKKDHPNVTVQFLSIPFADYGSKVTVQLAGGNPPDAGWLPEALSASWIGAGVLADMAPGLKSNQAYDFADFSTPALRLWQAKDALYGIPFSNSPAFMVYNKDLFVKAGIDTPDILLKNGKWTWEALATAAKTITEKNPGSYGYVYSDLYKTLHWAGMTPVMWAYGGGAWSDDGVQCQLDKPESVKAVQLMQDMIFKDKSMVPPGNELNFQSGKVGMSIFILSGLGLLKDAAFKWDAVPLPSGPAGNTTYIGQAAIVVFNQSKNKAAALDFAAFMTNKDNVAKFAAFFPPARKSVLAAGALMKSNALVTENINKVISDGIASGRTLPTHAEFAKIDLAAKAEFDKLWKADANVQTVLTGACKAIAPFMNK